MASIVDIFNGIGDVVDGALDGLVAKSQFVQDQYGNILSDQKNDIENQALLLHQKQTREKQFFYLIVILIVFVALIVSLKIIKK